MSSRRAFAFTERTARRRGTAYIFVLAVAALVTAAGITGMALTQARREALDVAISGTLAEREAEAALDALVSELSHDPEGASWRVGETVEITSASLLQDPRASLLVRLTDPADSTLLAQARDRVRAVVVATHGPARRQLAATLEPVPVAMRCLDFPVVSQSLTVRSGTAMYLDQGASATWLAQTVPTPARSGPPLTTIAPGFLPALVAASTAPANDLSRPNAALIDEYVAQGAMVRVLSNTIYQNRLLSPGSNPWGPVHPLGIYVFDCNGFRVDFRNMRVVGTLVLLNPGSGSMLGNDVLMEPSSDSRATLLVRGSINLGLSDEDLSESQTSVTLNPVHTPYLGRHDNDTSDDYPSLIRGLVYVSGDLKIADDTTIDGVLLVGGLLGVDDVLHVRHRPPGALVQGFTRTLGLRLDHASVGWTAD